MIDERFVILAAALNIIGCITYLIGTLKGKTKPNKVTWFLWTLAPMIAFSAQVQQGVGLQALFTFSIGLGPLLVFVGSFFNKKAHWKLTPFDIGCGVLSLLGLFLWYKTQSGDFAIFFSIVADFFAAIPTIIKSYKQPQTENASAFLLCTIAGLITLLTIRTWTFAYYGFSLYTFVVNFIFFSLIQFKIGRYFARR